jgi:hypothetical protein
MKLSRASSVSVGNAFCVELTRMRVEIAVGQQFPKLLDIRRLVEGLARFAKGAKLFGMAAMRRWRHR